MATQQTHPAGSTPFSTTSKGELDLFALTLLLRRHLRRTAIFTVIGFLVMTLVGLTARIRFASTATILVPQKSSSTANMALQALGGAGAELLGAGSGDVVYLNILKSRTVADALIRQFNLMSYYKVPEIGMAEILLANATRIASKDSMITVNVEDHDPKLASDLANAYFTQLHDLNLHLAVTAAGQQRVYYEQQMVQEKNALADAEAGLMQSQEKTGLIVPAVQAQAEVSAMEQTRAQLRLRQVQLGALEQGATAQNPEVVRLRSEIASLEGQLRAMQSGGGGPSVGQAVAKVPGQTLSYVRAAREVKFHETLFEMLAREYETAKQQEARDNAVLQILDPAIPAVRKTWPPRTLWSLAGAIGGTILGMFYTVLEALAAAVMRNPENRARLSAFISPEKAR